jgi:hypothetical protein
VDEDVDEVVAEDLDASKVVVQGKREIGKNTDRIAVLFNQLVQPLERKGFKMNAGIKGNVGLVVEVPGDLKTVGIGEEGQDNHQADGKAVPGEERAALLGSGSRFMGLRFERGSFPLLLFAF